MKNKKLIFIILMIFPLLISGISLFFLPNEFPTVAGLNLILNKNGMASKFNVLIFPIVSLLFGLLVPFMAKGSVKEHNGNEGNVKIIYTVGTALLAFFNLLNIILLIVAFKGFKSVDELSFDIYKTLFIALGVMMVIMGNIMPKVRMNSYLGLRTPWSMKDENSWKKCQRFGGIVLIIQGLILIIAAALTTGGLCVALSLIIVFFGGIIQMGGSLAVVSKDVKKEQKEKESK